MPTGATSTKYGNLSGMLSGEGAQRYRALKEEARALTARSWTSEQGDHMPEVTYRIAR